MNDFADAAGRPEPPTIVAAFRRLQALRSRAWGPFDDADQLMALARQDFFDALQREIVEPLVRDPGATPTQHAFKLAFARLVNLFHHQELEIEDQRVRGKLDASGYKMLLKIVDRQLRLAAVFGAKSRGGRQARGRGARRTRR